MLRTIVVFIALWGLAGVPVLCAGGVLLHACPCAEDEACQHEDECAMDPCTDLALRPGSPSEGGSCSPALLAVASLQPAIDGLITPQRQADWWLSFSRDNLPLPPSALPLLI
jgi:hypothetical protein